MKVGVHSMKKTEKSSTSKATKLMIWILVVSMAIPAVASLISVVLN